MKNVIDWIKANPFITVCGVVAVIGLAGMGYLRFVQAANWTETRSEELKKISNSQKQLMSVNVPLPNEDPNAPPIIASTIINDVVINDVTKVYSTIKKQYDQIKLDVEDVNSRRHQPTLLGGTDIWPDGTQFSAYVQAAADYREHFKALFDFQKPNKWDMPRMRASSPPSKLEVERVLATTAYNFVNSIGVTSTIALTEAQAEQLYKEQRHELMTLLSNRARRINLYAELPAEEDPFAVVIEKEDTAAEPAFGASPERNAGKEDNGYPEGYPFFIEQWAFADSPPQPDQLWEGQVQLWIMRDIMHAIAKVNNVESGVEVTESDGSVVLVASNVLNSPIKRLLRLQTLPGYVGLHTVGSVFDSNTDELRTSQPRVFDRPTGPVPLGTQGAGIASTVYPTPPLELQPKSTTEQAKDHFGITPTGRVSNAVYDVKHTRLVIDIEWDKLPSLMRQLRESNFMTVIKADISDIDEYQLLREGFVYGQNDVVRADLLIESLWFREWTGKLMPKVVREKLLIEIPEGTGIDPSGYGPGGPGYGPGDGSGLTP